MLSPLFAPTLFPPTFFAPTFFGGGSSTVGPVLLFGGFFGVELPDDTDPFGVEPSQTVSVSVNGATPFGDFGTVGLADDDTDPFGLSIDLSQTVSVN